MTRNCLTSRLTALTADPAGPAVRVNVVLSSGSAAAQQAAVARIKEIATGVVDYRPGMGLATALVPRARLLELNDIDGVENADVDVSASLTELID